MLSIPSNGLPFVCLPTPSCRLPLLEGGYTGADQTCPVTVSSAKASPQLSFNSQLAVKWTSQAHRRTDSWRVLEGLDAFGIGLEGREEEPTKAKRKLSKWLVSQHGAMKRSTLSGAGARTSEKFGNMSPCAWRRNVLNWKRLLSLREVLTSCSAWTSALLMTLKTVWTWLTFFLKAHTDLRQVRQTSGRFPLPVWF